MAPRGLKWDWPLFTPANEVDTSALLGVNKPGKPQAVPLEDFVDQCIATSDPCSKRSVVYEANQCFGLSERKAEEMLDLAMERGDVTRLRIGSRLQYVVCRPGITGDKGLWAAAILAHDPETNVRELAETVQLSERHVRRIKAELTQESQ